ncbi:N-acetyltransferase [candidate division WWE3 bacterium]|uniref:N-acetyltransferase n=1 Tax=candidate division WWE3 bacterium TaxID=2053526 RepID=A0A3A4ZEM0_UNCKA|nr:MAG: N-acetyltransferase [candidate division WWE3 bacterium]
MITISPAKTHEVVEIQAVLNHHTIIGYLGGFTIATQISQKIVPKKPSFFTAKDGTDIVGVVEIASRTQAHLIKYGMVGVIPEYRRQRIASSMYAAITFQGILEGRRLFEDSIVGDNPIQFTLLPTLGMRLAGELKHKTASAKSICLFQFDLLESSSWTAMWSRISPDISIQLTNSSYQTELYEKNKEILEKHKPEFVPTLDSYIQHIKSTCQIKEEKTICRDSKHQLL